MHTIGYISVYLSVYNDLYSNHSCISPSKSLDQDTSEPQPSTCETQGIHEYVYCHHDMNEIMLKAA